MGQASCKAQLENPNPSLYSEELWEEAKGQCSFFRSSQAAVIFRFTSGFSAISAFLIIYLILKSPTRLSSIYHRIMFGMSICQMIASVPRALTTLPMPAPGDYWTDIINIQGTRLGNTFTCTLQGFLIRLGDLSAGPYFLLGLTFYYTCAIGFEMDIKTLTKYVEPLIHSFCILWGLQSSLIPLFVGGYNVNFNTYDTLICAVAPKPWFCDNQNSTVTCLRGGTGKHLVTDTKLTRRYDPYGIVFIMICLLIICCRVYKKDREMARMIKDWEVDNNGRQNLSDIDDKPTNSAGFEWGNGEEISLEEIQQRIKDQYKDTKVIISQAALYFSVQIFILACELCYSFSIRGTNVLAVILALWSMQGFYQLFIFIFHKIFNQRRHNPNISIFDAIIEIFEGGPGNEAFIIADMNAVRRINKEMEPRGIYDSFSSGSLEDSEATPLLESCSVSGNFGSTSLPTAGRSLLHASSWGVDGNSNIQSIHTRTSCLYTNKSGSQSSSKYQQPSSSKL